MAQNYFSCVVCGNNGYRRAPEEMERLLASCKKDKAFYIEWGGYTEGALHQVNPGDIVFLSIRQYIVAFGEVTKVQYENVCGGKYKSAIYVKDWIGPAGSYRQGVFLRGNVMGLSEAHTGTHDKVKKFTDVDGARRLQAQLRQ